MPFEQRQPRKLLPRLDVVLVDDSQPANRCDELVRPSRDHARSRAGLGELQTLPASCGLLPTAPQPGVRPLRRLEQGLTAGRWRFDASEGPSQGVEDWRLDASVERETLRVEPDAVASTVAPKPKRFESANLLSAFDRMWGFAPEHLIRRLTSTMPPTRLQG